MFVRMEFLQGVLVVVVLVAFDLPDAWGSLRYSQSPRSMRPKSDPASRSPGLSPLGLWNPLQVASQSPLSPVSRNLAQDPFGLQEKQLLQGPVKPLDWRYPVVPEVQRELAVDFQLRQPVTPSSVAVQCSENRVLVEVQQDLFSNGQLIQPSGLSLGGCPVVGQDTESRVLIFEYELQDCNSVQMMNEDELVYTFSLTYTPEALAGTPITRADGAVVGIQCHYQRLQNVSSNALRPTWIPYASTEVGEEVLLFSLKLMMDDWSYQRPSNSYFLGGVINVEASVKVYNHVPLRVFVDSCVATQGPDVNSLPRYSFIENHGCFVDAKATASSSRFMPRSQEDKIQFQLEAFMFQESSSPYVCTKNIMSEFNYQSVYVTCHPLQIYITCILKATIASVPSDAQRKSCSFANGWFAADGNDQVCGCCDSTCGPDGGFAASPFGGLQWEGKASLGPVMVQERKTVSQ
ncbi:zona pellucida sperm-binding protein 3-like isoform X1 [Megalobrama amblycephala]|uniref:zona pellucida sperm-binding protein 3-like isoform X1 n=1 Tax=Megalobrama amblycephala TaxID=75352 RepID=UPI0020146E29|nr:zona pellucida sperm-binding protein 3-like isoform X1 [Megalobrama amblycephala]